MSSAEDPPLTAAVQSTIKKAPSRDSKISRTWTARHLWVSRLSTYGFDKQLPSDITPTIKYIGIFKMIEEYPQCSRRELPP